ncbi:MAG: acyl-CoA thioesterase [bacterium]|nr:acyl-CoA thioesterase [bacterium]
MEPSGEQSIRVRVRYPETDRMGVAWHGHYLAWFEIGRTELMRRLGCPYGELEDRDQVFFPVIEAGARYLAPARYDDELDVRTRLVHVGNVRVRFEYRLVRAEDDTTLATGFTVHAALGGERRPIRLPHELRERLTRGANPS